MNLLETVIAMNLANTSHFVFRTKSSNKCDEQPTCVFKCHCQTSLLGCCTNWVDIFFSLFYSLTIMTTYWLYQGILYNIRGVDTDFSTTLSGLTCESGQVCYCYNPGLKISVHSPKFYLGLPGYIHISGIKHSSFSDDTVRPVFDAVQTELTFSFLFFFIL